MLHCSNLVSVINRSYNREWGYPVLKYYDLQMRLVYGEESFWIEAKDIRAVEIKWLFEITGQYRDICFVREGTIGNETPWRRVLLWDDAI